jgi:di/tricarboxylate transporter
MLWGLTARAETAHEAQPEATPLEGTLRFIEARASARPVVTAGERGELSLQLSLAGETEAGQLSWNQANGPLSLQVVAPAESGITFPAAEEQHGSRSPHQFEMALPLPEVPTVTVRIPYSVSSRVRVKDYDLQVYLSAPLERTNGDQVEDSGTLTWPLRVETPLHTKMLVLLIIALAIFLFVVEWVRVDVVAILMMVSLPFLNLLGSRQTFTGLSSNAVIAIIGVMIVSAGLNKVGIVSRVVKPVIRLAGRSGGRLMVAVSALIAVISSVMQNTGAAVLFLPGIRHACKKIQVPISSVLMPIGMCAILGGTMTMIGTSPLILLNDILPEGMAKFSLLELTPIGVALVLGGIIYFSTGGRYFLSQLVKSRAQMSGAGNQGQDEDVRHFYHDLDGPFELAVPSSYSDKDRPSTVAEILKTQHTNIVSVAHPKGRLHELAPTPDTKIRPGYSLCAYGPEAKVKAFAQEFGLELLSLPRRLKELFNPAVAGVVEAVLSPRSAMIGSTVNQIGFRKTFGMTVLALYREGKTYYHDLGDIPLASGDALLLHSTWDRFHSFVERHRNFNIITPLEVEIQKPRKVTSAVISFLIALTLMLVSSFYFQSMPYNPIPLSVCLMTGALLMVLTKVISIEEAYKAVDWRTVFLLGGLIPLGMAVDRTGTAEWLARGIVSALGDAVTPLLLITVLAVMSGAFCLVISNVGACTLLVPLGVSMASQIGIDPRVAAIVVGLGVSNSFLLPTHQVNALYMGPGDYRTKDYMKIGGVMSVAYIAILVTMTYLFYM